jgi:hypothetical protein
VKTKLAVLAGADDVLLQWTSDALDDAVGGFAIQRDAGAGPQWLDNYAPPYLAKPVKDTHQSSLLWPFRCFEWTDFDIDAGETARYRVAPVIAGKPVLGKGSAWSRKVKVGSPAAHFNRAYVISQFMTRYLDEHYPGKSRDDALEAFAKDVAKHDDDIRAFLSGLLRPALLDVLGEGGDVHAALFELDDAELIDALAALGAKAHVVLSNGSISPRKGETTAQARTRDENADARAKLAAAGVDVSGRFVSPGALAHNKFLVAGTKVWTGSTNWTTGGLCTQLNNALLLDDAAVAAAYLSQWSSLRDAGNAHPADLSTGNATPTEAGTVSVHFSRASGRVDLAALETVVADARQGVLFLMFEPGPGGVVASVQKLAADHPDLLLRGVISQLPPTGDTSHVTLFGDPSVPDPVAATFDVVQPQGFAHAAAGWALETTRKQYLGHFSTAIVHSKVLVVDPLSTSPTVVTGSHNFSLNASESNDENFVVVRGDRALAQAYAVNVESAWRHYAARIGHAHPELGGIDYLRALLGDHRAEEPFWGLG